MRRLVSVLVVLIAGVLVSCGDDAGSSSATSHNAADVEFATMMIPHHAQALRMVEMADGRGADAGFGRLLDDIEAAQEPEMEQLAEWLEEWGEEAPPTDSAMGPGSGMAGSDGTGQMAPGAGGSVGMGMVSRRSLERLDATRDVAFERMWLRLMIDHHEGAVAMARTEVADGEHTGAVRLAEDIVAAQRKEIELMEDLLRR